MRDFFSSLYREKPIHLQAGMEKEQTLYVVVVLVAAVLGFWTIKRLYIDKFVGHFHKKYVLVTGCDSGFGRETALRLDSLGFNVFATCLTSEGQTQLTARCSKRLATLHLDVTNSQEIKEAFKFVAQHLPENAGKLFNIVLIKHVLFKLSILTEVSCFAELKIELSVTYCKGFVLSFVYFVSIYLKSH